MSGQRTVWPYIKGYKFNGLLLKNFMYVFILVTVPLLLVLSLNYERFNAEVNTRVMDMNEELLQKSAVVTDNTMTNVLDLRDKLAQLDFVVEIVQEENVDIEYIEKAYRTLGAVSMRILSNDFITSVNIYSDINGMYISGSGVKPISEVLDKGKWYDVYKQLSMDETCILVNNPNSIFACQPIRSEEGERIGILVMDVNLHKIRDLLENQDVAQRGIFFVLDASGQIMYCNDQNYWNWDKTVRGEYVSGIAQVEMGQSALVEDQNNRIISVMDSIHKTWHYAFVTELPDYKSEMETLRTFLAASVLVGLISSLVVAYIISWLTYRPVKKILNVIQNPQLHWDERQATKESNELLFITSNMLTTVNADKEISEELEERIQALRQAQFRALQFQIDPHFLYNTLETIKWTAVEDMGLGNRTSKMLTKVARLYRLGLENDDVIVSLREELDFLKLYIEVLRMRFGESVRFNWQIDENLYDCSIIKMCLQPIVENAVHHGLRPRNYQGDITISVYQEGETLYAQVENDGQNINRQEIARMNEKLKTGSGFEQSKVGLRNVNERIKLIYGQKYGVSINCSEPETEDDRTPSVRVVLTFPCRKYYRSEEKK